MASYDNDVLVDMGDYDSSSSSSDEKLFQRMWRVYQNGVHNCDCQH
jgi:hypothetical protein